MLEANPYNNYLFINASIHNDDQYMLTNATFYFDLLIDNNLKVGEATETIGRLLSGETYKVRIFTAVTEIKKIRVASVACHFTD